MLVGDFGLPAGKVSEGAERVFERAVAESLRRGHAELTGDHLFVAVAHVESNLFGEVMRAAGLNPHVVVIEVEETLAALPSVEGVEVSVSEAVRLLARMALHQATRAGRPAIEPADLLAAPVDDAHGARPSGVAGREDDAPNGNYMNHRITH